MEFHWDILRAAAELLEDIDSVRAGQLRGIADQLENRYNEKHSET